MKNAADQSRPFPLWLSYGELVIVGLLAPWFVFPDPTLTPWLMFIPAGLWLLRWIIGGRLTVRTPLDVPLLVIALTLCVSILVTIDPFRSFPKIAGVYYGIIVFYVIVNHLRSASAIRLVVTALVVAGTIIAIIALMDTNWSGIKVPILGRYLQPIYRQMPDTELSLPRAETGFNSNQVGGTLALLIPLQMALALYTWRRASGRKPSILIRLGLTVSCAITGFALILTQSRGALGAVMLALSLLLFLRGRRSRVLLAFVLLAAAIAIALMLAAPSAPVSDDDLDAVVALSGRPEIWHRSLRVIRDHPLTGIGFDNLTAIVHARYPTFKMPVDSEIAHAHNIFFQVALDLGIPGLVAFLAALLCALWQLIQSYRCTRDPFRRAVVLGIALGIGAQMAFGMADAIALGQKPGLLLWIYLGLATVLNLTIPEPVLKDHQALE
jgi:putative inorganic carbon (HCO3(-)) transporter